jgi:ribosomal protein S3
MLFFFFQLEKILKTQVFFKFKNICTGLLNSSLTTALMLKLNNHLSNRLTQFKYQFKEEIYANNILFVLNLFKFKIPDGVLFANYIASILPLVQKHTQFLMFIKFILQSVKKIFKFSGVKILLSGKLNGFSRAQSKQIQIGSVPLQSTKFSYITGEAHSFTNAGKIGVKV